MKTIRHFIPSGILSAISLAAFGLVSTVATAGTVNAIYNAATDVPVTASDYTATGNSLNFTLNYAPATGTDLVVVQNTGLAFINGTFDNLAQGQGVALSYGGVTYRFVANYYGGSGNDLVLVWSSNRAFAWGNNGDGQLGDNTSTQRQLPVPVTATDVLAGKTVVAVAAGGYHSLALCSDGIVVACGLDGNGQLGDNNNTERHFPVAVNTASGVSALFGERVVAITAGYRHSLALCSDGTVTAWGYNFDGQLGNNGVSGMQSLVPVAVDTNSGVSALHGKTVVAIAAGFAHSLALSSDGTVAAWGRNNYGQLGDNTTTQRNAPVAVNAASGSALYGKTVVAIAPGAVHSLALCSDGTVAAWGWNTYGQLGDNTTTDRHIPVAVNTNSGSALYGKTVVAIAAGADHSVALCSDGTVAAWGWNQYGQLGDGTTTVSSPFGKTVPVAVNTNSGVSALYSKTVVAIAAGYYHSLALCSDGTVAAWGHNDYGQIGDNTTTQRAAPVALNTAPLAASQRFTRVTSGASAYHTVALVAGPPACETALTGPQMLTNGAFQFGFTNIPGAFFGVLAATNPALPLGNWTSLTGLTEVSPGQFQFADPQATNSPRCFYRVRSP
jgi:alpha-tubulin suppressor-like RCC1 family protein